ncbi:MAG: glycerol-3-phosphate O-acyltransferase, partial [Mycobacterium sp.]|nr:glycerol-3-phosphate O-acyltransferase [Mycobacterium sp.]
MKVGAEEFASFRPTDDTLVLASVDSPAELELLNDWLGQQRRAHPDAR